MFGIPQNCVLQLCNWPINTAWEAVSLCDNDLLPNLAAPGSLGHVRAGEHEREHAYYPVTGQEIYR